MLNWIGWALVASNVAQLMHCGVGRGWLEITTLVISILNGSQNLRYSF